MTARWGTERGRLQTAGRAAAWCAGAAVLVLLLALASPAQSLASGAPSFGLASSAGTSNDEPTIAELEVSIRPNGLETSYEFWIENEGKATKVGEGKIAASRLEQEVTVKVSSLLPKHTYSWEVVAHNADGTAIDEGKFETYPELPAGCPYGCSSPKPVETEIPKSVVESTGRSASEAPQREAEREAKLREEAERPAKEAAAREAKEREQREAGERAGREAAEKAELASSTQCLVPKLTGDSLEGARRALRRAHCALGKVRGAKAHRQHLVVISQGAHSGRKLPKGATVAVTLGARPHTAAHH